MTYRRVGKAEEVKLKATIPGVDLSRVGEGTRSFCYQALVPRPRRLRHHGEMIKDVAHEPETAGAAYWLTERIAAFAGQVVLSVVPGGYEAYARIFHPAAHGGRSQTSGQGKSRLIGPR